MLLEIDTDCFCLQYNSLAEHTKADGKVDNYLLWYRTVSLLDEVDDTLYRLLGGAVSVLGRACSALFRYRDRRIIATR